MLILRVETEDGRGPWCDERGSWDGGAGTNWCAGACAVHNSAIEYMRKAKQTYPNRAYRFGFLSWEQMFNYMNPVRSYQSVDGEWREAVLRQFGYMAQQSQAVYVFELEDGYAHDVIGDHTQCIFLLHTGENNDWVRGARRIKRLDPLGGFIRDMVLNYQPMKVLLEAA